MGETTILYVEDDELVRLTIADLLEAEGWRVRVCADGINACMRLASEEHYDLILLDNALPGVRGMELVREVRRLAHRRGTPVVMFSASECGKDARGAGADEFLKKPDGVEVLVETIRRALSASGKGAEGGEDEQGR